MDLTTAWAIRAAIDETALDGLRRDLYRRSTVRLIATHSRLR
ncbi:MAG: hypothetical protein RBR16_07580 [Syntrophus sp. (in: bacteria)]|jgi:hypothetical protein|nr:hypothetical protein [Syntrophus sp. (in: bacteria)]